MKYRSHYGRNSYHYGKDAYNIMVDLLEKTTHVESEFEVPDWAKEETEEKKTDAWYCPECGYKNQGFRSTCVCGANRK